MAPTRLPLFRGRITEREDLDRLLATVAHGRSQVLMVRGEAGAGKSALMRYVAGQAVEFRAAQISGVESEMELPFAGLHQLCSPMLAHDAALPSPSGRLCTSRWASPPAIPPIGSSWPWPC